MTEPYPRPRFWLTLAFWAAALAAMALASLLAKAVPAQFYPIAWGTLASLALYTLARWLARRSGASPQAIGLGWSVRSLPNLITGLVLGLGTFAATIAIDAALFGAIRFVPVAQISLAAIVVTLAGLAATITMEELAFRSFALWNSVTTIGKWAAQALVALAFGALHLLYGWPIMTVLLGVLPSAVLFGAAAIKSRGLAMPLGLHFGLVASRVLLGETDQPIVFSMDTSAMDPASAGELAPLVGAAVPLLFAAIILMLTARRGPASG